MVQDKCTKFNSLKFWSVAIDYLMFSHNRVTDGSVDRKFYGGWLYYIHCVVGGSRMKSQELCIGTRTFFFCDCRLWVWAKWNFEAYINFYCSNWNVACPVTRIMELMLPFTAHILVLLIYTLSTIPTTGVYVSASCWMLASRHVELFDMKVYVLLVFFLFFRQNDSWIWATKENFNL